MPFPLAGLLGASTLVGGHVTRQFITSGVRSGAGQFAQSLPFGAGYSLGTYIGFPKNYEGRSSTYKPQRITLNEKMTYGRSQNRSYRKRFSFRYTRWFNKKVYSRKYRRSIYVHQNRRFY